MNSLSEPGGISQLQSFCNNRQNESGGETSYIAKHDGNAVGSSPVRLPENKVNIEGKLLRLDSGYLNDDRSHWDLNTVMDKWENPPEDLLRAPRADSSAKIPGRSLNNKNSGCSEDIHVQVAVAEWKGDHRSLEQNMVRKGFQSGMDVQQLNISSVEHVDSNISLGLHSDTIFKHHSVHDKVLANCDLLAMNVVKSDGSGSENSLNLSIALSQGISDSAKDVYTGSEIDRQEASNVSQDSEMHVHVPADRHLTLIPAIFQQYET